MNCKRSGDKIGRVSPASRFNDLVRRFCSSSAGVAATEFALVSPVFVVLTLGVIDVGTAVFERFELKTAARVGAEYALNNLTDTAGIEDAVVRATNHESQSITVTTFTFCECEFEVSIACTETCENGDAPRKFVTVRVTDFYNPVFLPEPDTPEDENFSFFQTLTQLETDVTLRIE